MLPEVMDSADDFGIISEGGALNGVPVLGIAGDQQAALFGQTCFNVGMAKSTYGTGCFLLLNTGSQVVQSENRLLSTVAFRLNGEASYAVEGSIFMAGATVQWIRDGLKLIEQASESEVLAQKLSDLLNLEVLRPELTETTALGAAYVAGLQAGIFESLDKISAKWKLDQRFEAGKDDAWREKQYDGWLDAVSRTRTNIVDRGN